MTHSPGSALADSRAPLQPRGRRGSSCPRASVSAALGPERTGKWDKGLEGQHPPKARSGPAGGRLSLCMRAVPPAAQFTPPRAGRAQHPPIPVRPGCTGLRLPADPDSYLPGPLLLHRSRPAQPGVPGGGPAELRPDGRGLGLHPPPDSGSRREPRGPALTAAASTPRAPGPRHAPPTACGPVRPAAAAAAATPAAVAPACAVGRL